MLTVRENLAMLVGSRRLALTDPLTGLGNRRQLLEDLELACNQGRAGQPWQLILYDLNGFKRYNDTFGHPAGDALLARLSGKLSASVARHGTAYRMGGDEFCVLIRVVTGRRLADARPASQALSERGPGFRSARPTARCISRPRAATRPRSCSSPTSGCTRARTQTREGSAVLQLRDVLLQAFRERYPDLQEHQRGVRTLALAVGRRMGLDGEELDVLARAAELHDVGKLAIPDAILASPARSTTRSGSSCTGTPSSASAS